MFWYNVLFMDETTMTTPELDPALMRSAASKASTLLKVLGNPDRLLLLCQLAQGPLCVSELEALVGVQQPTLSQQLGVLRDEALVTTRREGKQIYYSIASAEALAVMQLLYQLYCGKQNGGHDDN